MLRQSIGTMTERIQALSRTPVAVRISSLTRSGTVASATTAAAHGWQSGDRVTVAGASPAGYLGTFSITVTGLTGFTFTVADTLTTPATGAIAATYVSDALGGRKAEWWTVATMWAEFRPGPVSERLQASAIRGQALATFRVHYRTDLTRELRILWGARTFEIVGLSPIGRQWLLIDAVEAS